MMRTTNGFHNLKHQPTKGFKPDRHSVFCSVNLYLFMSNYYRTAKKTGDYSKADQVLEGIKKYQKKYGAASICLLMIEIELEIAYNKLQRFYQISSKLLWSC